MRGLVIFLLVLIGIASFSFIVISASNDTKIHTPKHGFLSYEFSTFTSAVCQNNGNSVKCKDEVFVKCNENVSRAEDISDCNGFKVEIPKTLGFATFSKDWKDPRN